jgi:hypothetical protein
MYLKDWLDTKIRDHYHSNMYDIYDYDALILFFCVEKHSIFSDFFIYFSNFI